MNIDNQAHRKIIEAIAAGETIYMPTDTIPGLVAGAQNPNAIENIYVLKQRNSINPPTIIIAHMEQLAELLVETHANILPVLMKHWPGPVSIVLPVHDPQALQYLHRGQNSLAIRLTANPVLAEIIEQTGPLATSSANISGQPYATTAQEARDYFGDGINTYIEHGQIDGSPSRIIKLDDSGRETILR